jgi:hypothetical protein
VDRPQGGCGDGGGGQDGCGDEQARVDAGHERVRLGKDTAEHGRSERAADLADAAPATTAMANAASTEGAANPAAPASIAP